MTQSRRLGLLGGSFDPVHVGHLHVARSAQAACSLDRIVFVPAARPPHKRGLMLAPNADRLAMVQLAIEGEPSWCACDLELGRPGPSYTIDTVRALARAVDEPLDSEVFLILGSDNLEGLAGWREVETLLSLARPIVVLREGDPQELPARLVERLPRELVERLEQGFLRLAPAPGRATDLRAAIAAGVEDLPELPAAVREYIRARGLYRDPLELPQ